MTSACSTWTLPSVKALRVNARCSSASANRIARWAWGRVVLVVTACQLAVDDLAVSPAMSMRSAWVSSRASSSASWALAEWTSARALMVSVASRAHTAASARSDS